MTSDVMDPASDNGAGHGHHRRASLAALGSTGTLRPGLLSKLLGWSLALLPRWARVRVMTTIMAGLTRRL